MIPRYTRPEMASIWEPQTRFKIWFEIEAHAADALAEIGIIPKEAAKTIWAKAKDATFDVARIDEIERETKHDVIAFLTHLAEIVGPEARFVHQGMTSSDVLDTCFNVQLTRAADLLLSDIDKVLAALKKRAFEHKMTPTIGRSHGIHAEPVTFGLKLAYAYAEFSRARERLVAARKEVATCAISGAVGTFAQIDPRVEEHVAKAMGLVPEPISTQVIPRDRHAMYFATLGVIASSVERLVHRNPPSAAHRSAGSRGILLRGPEGLVGDAAQAQPGAVGKPHRPVAHGARLCDAGDGKRRALARARHLALLGRTHDRTRCHSDARFRADAPCRPDREAAGLSRQHAEEPRPPRGPRAFAAASDRADAKGRQPRGRLQIRAAQRDAGMARRRRLPDAC